MSNKDLELIEIANSVESTNYEVIGDLIKLAESDEVEKELKRIMRSKYHKEEFDNELL